MYVIFHLKDLEKKLPSYFGIIFNVKKSCKDITENSHTPHPVSPNINILHTTVRIKTKRLTFVYYYELQTFFGFHPFFSLMALSSSKIQSSISHHIWALKSLILVLTSWSPSSFNRIPSLVKKILRKSSLI